MDDELPGRIISQRHFSDCSLLVATRATPEQAYAVVQRHFPNRAEPLPMRFRVPLQPLGFFVLTGRIVQSVGGSNVYVCVASRLLYAVALYFLLWLVGDDGTAWALAIAAFVITTSIVKYRASKIARSLAAELWATARR